MDDMPIIFYDIEKAINEGLFCRITTSMGEEFFCFITHFDGAYIKTKTMCGVGNNEDDADEIFMDRTILAELIATIDLDVLHILPFDRLQAFKRYKEIFFKPKQKKKRGRPRKNAQEQEKNA